MLGKATAGLTALVSNTDPKSIEATTAAIAFRRLKPLYMILFLLNLVSVPVAGLAQCIAGAVPISKMADFSHLLPVCCKARAVFSC
jgi:hypothetical protein